MGGVRVACEGVTRWYSSCAVCVDGTLRAHLLFSSWMRPLIIYPPCRGGWKVLATYHVLFCALSSVCMHCAVHKSVHCSTHVRPPPLSLCSLYYLVNEGPVMVRPGIVRIHAWAMNGQMTKASNHCVVYYPHGFPVLSTPRTPPPPALATRKTTETLQPTELLHHHRSTWLLRARRYAVSDWYYYA